jgi:hypothetical protein
MLISLSIGTLHQAFGWIDRGCSRLGGVFHAIMEAYFARSAVAMPSDDTRSSLELIHAYTANPTGRGLRVDTRSEQQIEMGQSYSRSVVGFVFRYFVFHENNLDP